MNGLIDNIFEWLNGLDIDPRIVVLLIAILPIAEARLSIPIALKCGLSPLEAFLFGFVGSTAAAPILLVALMPLIKYLASTKLFKKLGDALIRRFESKASGIESASVFKRMLGTAAFVAVPLPLTGVWTGSAIASILGIGYLKALAAVTVGNLIASTIILITTMMLSEYINTIMAIFAAIALIAALSLLIKAIRPGRSA